MITFNDMSSLGSTACVSVTIIDDTVFESQEEFTATLNPGSEPATVSSSAASASIFISQDLNDG